MIDTQYVRVPISAKLTTAPPPIVTLYLSYRLDHLLRWWNVCRTKVTRRDLEVRFLQTFLLTNSMARPGTEEYQQIQTATQPLDSMARYAIQDDWAAQ